MIFAMLYRQSWIHLYEILFHFQRVSALCINERKSSFHHGNINTEELEYLSHLLNIQAKSIKQGIKYLGYHLKPIEYYSTD